MFLLLITACEGHRDSRVYHDDLHKVKKGETLYAIAFRHGLDYKKVARWNNIRSPYTIYVGQVLKLRPVNVASKKHGKKKTEKRNKTIAVEKHQKRSTPATVATKSTPVKHTWDWPTQGKVIRGYSSKFGGNKGIDIGGKIGQPVLAASSGRVVYSGSGLASYGNLVIVKHSKQFLSAYAHNKRLFVKEGREVKRGEKIAELGNTGTSEAKLHFEIRFNGKPVDPMKYLPKR